MKCTRPWDTYSAWRGKSHNINRLITGWLILTLLPVAQFAILFTLLGLFNVTFDETVSGVLRIILISISAFFSFGYFRIYEAFIHRFPESFFSEEERRKSYTLDTPAFLGSFHAGNSLYYHIHPHADGLVYI